MYRCALDWVNDNGPQHATNVIHIHKSSSNAAAVASALDSNVTAAMWTFQPNYAHISQLVITPLDGLGVSLPVITGSPAKWSGNGGSGDMIPQVANVIKMLTLKRGRSYRGRVFLPWVLEGLQNGGTLSGASVTTTTNAWVAFHTALTSAGFDLVVASYLHATADNVAGLICEPLTATQRRRQLR